MIKMPTKCPTCNEDIDPGQTYYDHWCDMGEADEVCELFSNLLQFGKVKLP